MVPVKPPPSKVWKVESMVVRPDADTISRHLARKRSPSRRSCGSQRQPVRSPMRCRPFIFLCPPKCEGEARVSTLAFHPRLAAQTALFDRAQFVQNLLNVLPQLIDNCINQSASDRDSAWKFRQLQYFEPPSVLDFRVLKLQIAFDPVANERDHERVRERPGLAGEITDVVFAHAAFLGHPARQELLHPLPPLGKTRPHAATSRPIERAAPERGLPGTPDQRLARARHP